MRYSKQRATIMQIVQMNPVHPTADWVYSKVRDIMPNISLGTVYRNLNQLVANKTLQAIRFGNVIHYDSNTDHHPHFFCNNCNQIYDLDHPVSDLISDLNNNCEHNITGGNFQLTGTCQNCITVN